MTIYEYKNWLRGYIDAVKLALSEEEIDQTIVGVLEEAYSKLNEVIPPFTITTTEIPEEEPFPDPSEISLPKCPKHE